MRYRLFENHVHRQLTGRVPFPPPTGVLGGAARDPARSRRAAEIAELARAVLGLGDDTAVTVAQLACREPGCPPVETVIAVLDPAGRRWTIHRPLADIDDPLVTGLLTLDAHGEPHAR